MTSPAPAQVEAEAARPILREARERWLAPLERRYREDLLRESGGNVKAAAGIAGVDRVTFYRLLDRRGLSRSRPARGG